MTTERKKGEAHFGYSLHGAERPRIEDGKLACVGCAAEQAKGHTCQTVGDPEGQSRVLEAAPCQVCEHLAEHGAYYDGKSYVEASRLNELIAKWRKFEAAFPDEEPSGMSLCALELENVVNG